MNEAVIITALVVIDDVMTELGHESHGLSSVSDGEVLLVGVVAALYFRNHQERALCVMLGMGYIKGHLSVSRFNRRLHALSGWLNLIVEQLMTLFTNGESFVLDSMPLPVCKRVRASRCRKVRGRAYCGYCAAKKEKFFGWRLHLVCTPDGLPVSFEMVPAAYHDLTPVHELTVNLPEGACVYADKAYNSADDERSIFQDTGVRLVPIRRVNMKQHAWADDFDLRLYRHSIETRNSQLETMGIQSLHARTNTGFEIKVLASLLALACINLN
jgi:Transposase DDE domain